MDKLYIIIPAYNEEANIKSVIDQWYPIVEKFSPGIGRLVIIDDGSKDSTYEIIKNCSESRVQMIALTKENSGHGATILEGYHYAIENGADYIFQTDSDGQTLPEEFEQFWNVRADYDMVIGWRNTREDGFSRVIVTNVLKMVVRLTFHVYVKDANTPYRLMKANVLSEFIDLIPEGFFLSNVAIAAIFEKKKCDVKYIPITFRPRAGGENSINIKSIIKHGKHALSAFPKMNKQIDNIN